MTEQLISIALGVGLAASVGFRIFVPLLALSAASYFGLWELNENWEWLGGQTALIVFGAATIVEIMGYFIPFIDNLLDTIAVPLATVAGTAVMVSTLAEMSPVVTWALAIIAGGGTAAAIKSSIGGTRVASSVGTAGLGNPVIATVETGTSVLMSILTIFVPVLGFILVIVILYFILKLYRKIRRSKQ